MLGAGDPSFDADLPALSPSVAAALAGLLVVTWLALRVQVLRRRTARREPDEPEIPATPWMRALARSRATNAVLALTALALGLLLAWLATTGR